MSLTNDPNDPALNQIRPDGQQEKYLVLSEEERAKVSCDQYGHKYRHLKCGTITTMGQALAETYARDARSSMAELIAAHVRHTFA